MATNEPVFVIEDLHVTVEDKPILKGVNLTVNAGEVHALMGPNGSGKTTLANALLGHPNYKITQGRVTFKGEDITNLSPDERTRKGIFLAFQYPTAIPGVTLVNFLRASLNAVRGEDVPIREFRTLLKETMDLLKIDESFARRYVNEGFSGGEKKRAEVLQMGILRPDLAILDETDSGLDIDALRTVAEGINTLMGPKLGIVAITHYQRLLDYIEADYVHVLYDGRIIKTGGRDLVGVLERGGYDPLIQEYEATAAVA
jgi:Fe-S cluster assembly ATP-binding protein